MEVIKCKFIILTKPVKKHWYFFLFLLGSFLRILIPDILSYLLDKNNSEPDSDSNLYNKNFGFKLSQKYFELIRNIASDILIGIFHCIHKCRNKDENKKRPPLERYKRNSQKIVFIFNDEEDKFPIMYKIIFIISLVDIICQLLLPIYIILDYKIFKNEKTLRIEPIDLYYLLFFDIFARYIFSRLLLKTYFYKHHYLSFILNIIGLISITIVEVIIQKLQKIAFDFQFSFFVLIVSIQLILYSFEDIMNKVAFRTLYILPNTLIFYKGLVQLIYFAIISGLFFGFERKYFTFDYKFEAKHFLCFVPFNILRTIFLVKVIDKFSAQHMTILKVFETVIYFLYNISLKHIITDNNKYNEIKLNISSVICLTVQTIGFLLLLFASLIHNELIIINTPSLKAKTEYYLDKDADREQYSSYYSDTLFTNSKETTSTVTNLYSDLTGSDLS